MKTSRTWFAAGLGLLLSASPFTSEGAAPPPPAAPRDFRDILPIQPVMDGDFPKLVAVVRSARAAGDASICNQLPTPESRSFSFGDYSVPAPNRAAWVAFCTALANKDRRCYVEATGHPNLQQECKQVMEQQAMKADPTPAFCLEQVPDLYRSADEVLNCYKRFERAKLSPAQAKIFDCLAKSGAGSMAERNAEDACLEQLAKDTREPRLCNVLYNTYRQPECLAALKPKPATPPR